jgi:hypothetical protein
MNKLDNWQIEVDLNQEDRQNLEYTSPQAVDAEGDELNVRFAGFEQARWLSVKWNDDNSFTMIVRTSLITASDRGAHKFRISLGDSNSTLTRDYHIMITIQILGLKRVDAPARKAVPPPKQQPGDPGHSVYNEIEK